MLIRTQNDFKQLLQSLRLRFCTPDYKRYSSSPSLALLKRVHVYDRSRVGRLHPTQLRKAYPSKALPHTWGEGSGAHVLE